MQSNKWDLTLESFNLHKLESNNMVINFVKIKLNAGQGGNKTILDFDLEC